MPANSSDPAPGQTPTTAAVLIQLDDQPYQMSAGSTLSELVAALGHADNAVATAVNTCFVPRQLRSAHVLQTGDTVLLFQAIVGG